MIKRRGFKKITNEDAFSQIGLHFKDKSTCFLGNMIIEIEKNGLKITLLNSSKFVTPAQTQFTTEPIKYVHSQTEYLVANENGEFVIYEEEKIVNGKLLKTDQYRL